MRVIPVLDVTGGRVVRGVAGRRDTYRPLVTPLCHGSDPLAVAGAFRGHFGLTTCYLADLDAIAGRPADVALYRRLADDGFALWADAGVRTPDDIAPLLHAGVESVIVGLETVATPADLAACVAVAGGRAIFSLDLIDGVPMGGAGWGGAGAAAVARTAHACGVRRLLVLDLAAVGRGRGTPTTDFCAGVRGWGWDELITGGGVRDRADLDRLRAAGVGAALVASALHAGTLTREDVDHARHS